MFVHVVPLLAHAVLLCCSNFAKIGGCSRAQPPLRASLAAQGAATKAGTCKQSAVFTADCLVRIGILGGPILALKVFVGFLSGIVRLWDVKQRNLDPTVSFGIGNPPIEIVSTIVASNAESRLQVNQGD